MLISFNNNLYKKQNGFTLIEVMIVVVIVSILVAIGVPSYQNYVMRSKRSVAKTAMLDVASKQETFRMDNKAYTADVTNLNFPGAVGATTFWVDDNNRTFSNAVVGSIYSITVTATVPPATPGFTVTATAIGSQAADTNCPTMSVNQLGNRNPNPDPNNCW